MDFLEDEATPESAGEFVFGHLEVASQVRLTVVLRDQLPQLFRLTRAIEQQTGYSSEIGQNMLVDVLSHIGTLASEVNLSPVQQASQISKIEEHMRRALIEHPEEVLRDRISDVAKLWSEYHRDAMPLRNSGDLRGVPLHRELEELRQAIDALLESARAVKPSESTWAESLDAAAEITEAAKKSQELVDKLEHCIGSAQRLTADRARDRRVNRQWVIGIAVAVVLFVAGIVVSYELGKTNGVSQHKIGVGHHSR